MVDHPEEVLDGLGGGALGAGDFAEHVEPLPAHLGDGSVMPGMEVVEVDVDVAAPERDGEEYDYSDLESWSLVAPTPGDVLEALISGSEIGPEADVAAFLVEETWVASDGGLGVKSKFIGARFPGTQKTMSSLVNRQKQYLHICRAGPVECTVQEETMIHIGCLRWFRPSRFEASYLTSSGKRTLSEVRRWREQQEELAGNIPAPARTPSGKGGATPPLAGVGDRSTSRLAARDALGAGSGKGATKTSLEDTLARLRARVVTPPGGGTGLGVGKGDAGPSLLVDRMDGSHGTSLSAQEGLGPSLATAARRDLGLPPGNASGGERGGRDGKDKKAMVPVRDMSARSLGKLVVAKMTEAAAPPDFLEQVFAKQRSEQLKFLGMLLQRIQEELDVLSTGTPGGGSVMQASRVVSYLQQVIRPKHGMGWTRDLREMLSLAVVIDKLRQGQVAEAGDVLAARFLAIETAMNDGSWTAAQHLELAAPEAYGAVTPGVLLKTRKHAVSAARASGAYPPGPWKGKGYHLDKGYKGYYKGKPKGKWELHKGDDAEGKGKEKTGESSKKKDERWKK
ncbi:unnamed protein product [Symbiodinium natans]|uniref:Uncharacterized protein n=1 Tax=Symbiodinium natans TaxID=878477 RepID=A0A812KU08_9DINO|nr:unnamed protein product [Symbiodinium natans]